MTYSSRYRIEEAEHMSMLLHHLKCHLGSRIVPVARKEEVVVEAVAVEADEVYVNCHLLHFPHYH